MLFIIYKVDYPGLDYQGGQESIVHLEADLDDSVAWVEQNKHRWVFTLSSAGSYRFDDYCDLNHLNKIDWEAVQAKYWRTCKESKQAEFLLENRFPWHLIERIGVYSRTTAQQTVDVLVAGNHRPPVEILKEWYY